MIITPNMLLRMISFEGKWYSQRPIYERGNGYVFVFLNTR
jgi:hypothetical protein